MVQPPIPKKAQWESNMLTWGRVMGQRIAGDIPYYTTDDQRLEAVYYDGSWVLYRIGQYLNLATEFNRYSLFAQDAYLDYLLPANWVSQGYRTFSQGFESLYNASIEPNGKNYVKSLTEGAAFSRNSTPLSGSIDANGPSNGYGGGIREAAYCVQTYVIYQRLGLGSPTKFNGYIDQLLDAHFPQLFTLKTTYIKPFMVALAAEALIMVYEQYPTHARRADIVSWLTLAADYMWDNMWVANNPGGGAFMYRSAAGDGETTDPAVDLNLLIAPMYAWLYHITGLQRFLDRGDQIFAQGVTTFNGNFITAGAYILAGKQFDQNYRWSFDYITWREADPLPSSGGGSGGGTGGTGGGTGGTGGGTGGTGGGTGGGGSGTGGTGGTGLEPNTPSELVVGVVPAIIVPVVNETWDQHFTNNGWANIQEQIDEGYTFFLQPGAVTATFEEIFDLGTTINDGTLVTLSYNPEAIAGLITVAPTLSLGDTSVPIPKAAQFTAANSEYLNIASNTDLQTGNIDFTFAAWVYLDSKGANRMIISKDNGTTNQEYNILYRSSDDRFVFQMMNSAGTVKEAVGNVLGSPATAMWYFIVAWHDSVADTVNIQINNGTANSTATAAQVPNAASAQFRLGARQLAGSENYMNGRLDSVGFWKRTLTADEKTYLYNSGQGRVYSNLGTPYKVNLISWWDLDETSGNRDDAHANNNLTDNNTVTGANGMPNGAVFNFTDYPGQNQVFASGFRYVKIHLDITGDSDLALARIPQIRVRIAAKEKRDAGSGEVTNASTGVVVTFNKTFVDIDSITTTAAYVLGGGEQNIAVYDFEDVPNPTQFTVYLIRRSDGTKVTGFFSWAAKGV